MVELPHLQDSFVEKLLDLMPRLVACKPLDLVKILQTTLRQSRLTHLKLPEQVCSFTSKCLFRRRFVTANNISSFWPFQIHRASATIIEPTGESDNPLRFTSGLVLALDIDATLEHVQDPQATVKVQVRVLSLQSHSF